MGIFGLGKDSYVEVEKESKLFDLVKKKIGK
jgi:hypothetical protein